MARIRVTAAAQLQGVTGQTIRNWIRSGLLTGYRVGPRLLLVDEAELASLTREVES